MSYLDLEPKTRRESALDDSKPLSRNAFRPEIEGLRALAVLLVVLYHCGAGVVSGGFVGVDVFFVISGYLITGQLAREAAGTGRLRIGRFYARRALRLLPAATVVLVSTLVATWVWLPPLRLRAIAADAMAAAGYVLNVRQIQVGNDYRSSGAAPSPLQHFWSLAVEEQFYLVVPLLVLIGLVLLRRRAILVTVLAGLVTASFALSVATSTSNAVAAYLGAPTRAWELGAGALLALLLPTPDHDRQPEDAPLRGRWGRAAAGWGGLGAIGCAAVTFDRATEFPGWLAAIPVLGAVAVLAAGSAGPGRVLALPLPQFVGARSYSWYLWHWPVLIVAPYLLGHEIGLGQKLLAALVALGLACVSYTTVEQPLRRHPRLRESPRRTAVLAAGLTAATLVLAVATPALPARQTQGEGLAGGLSLAGPPSARNRQLTGRLEAATATTALPRNLEPSLRAARTDDPAIARNGCLLAVDARTSPKHCESLGDPDGRTTVALFGDSHAAQWFPALNAMAHKRHWRLAVFTKLMCSPADVELYAEQYQGAYRSCDDWRWNSVRRLRALRPDRVLVTSIADHMDLAERTHDPDTVWADGWARAVDQLRDVTPGLVFLADTPKARTDVPECLSQNPRDVPVCAQTPAAAAGSSQRARISEAVRASGVRVIDPTPWFCNPTSCPVVVDNTLVYRDDNHITGRYARTLAPLLLEQLLSCGRACAS